MKSRNKGVLLTYISTVLNLAIGIFLSSYIVKMLGKTEYGLYSMMSAFVSYLSLLEFGVGTLMVRNVSMCKGKGADAYDKEIFTHISTLLILTALLSAAIALVGTGFCLSIPLIYKKSLTPSQITYCQLLFILTAAKLLITFPIQTMSGIFVAYEKYTLSATFNLIQLVVRSLTVVCVLYFWSYAWVLLTADLVLYVIEFIYYSYYCLFKLKIRIGFKYFDKSILISITPLALAMLLQSVMNMANNNVDNFVIGVMLSPEQVAVYAVGMFVYSNFSIFTAKPINLYMPQVAKDMQSGKRGLELTKTLIEPCRLTAIIGGALLFGFVAVGRPFIQLLYGKDYLKAWIIAIVVMIPQYISMSNSVALNVLDILNKRHIRSLMLMGTTISNIILTVIWIRIWGIIGAAMATAICTMIGDVALTNIYYKKVININVMYLFYRTFKGILIPLAIGSALANLTNNIVSSDIVSLLMGGVIFISVSFILFWIFGATEKEKMFFINKFGKGVKLK